MKLENYGVVGNFMHWIKNPFLSTYISATTTILAGLIALFVYRKQKSDTKRAAALLIFHEIVYADQIAKNAGEIEGIKYYLRLLPSQNWLMNKHLFTPDFNREELQLIDQFYARATDIDRLMDAISSQLNNLPATDLRSMNTRIALGIANDNGTSVMTHDRIRWLKREIVENSLIGTSVLKTLESQSMSKFQKIRKLYK